MLNIVINTQKIRIEKTQVKKISKEKEIMDNLSDQMGILSDDFIEECSEDSDDHGHSKNAPLREQDRFLPIANIAKIMKRAIPENGKVSK